MAGESPIPRTHDRTWIGIIALVMLMVVSVQLIGKADSLKPADWTESRLTYLPSGKLLKPMAMDLDEAMADLIWIQAMMYFADAYLTGKSYQWMGHMLDVITQLNPHMYQAYEFAGVGLTKQKEQLPKTLRLLDRGIGAFPKDWRLRVYASLAQLSHDSDFTLAAEYLKPVTLDSAVPDHIRTLCATLLSKGGGRRVALAFLMDRYVNSSNAINKEIFLEKILELYPAGSLPSAERRETVSKILYEVSLEPMATLMGLGVMHEYLTDSLSEGSRNLLELLRR
jgi:hypothetical protein